MVISTAGGPPGIVDGGAVAAVVLSAFALAGAGPVSYTHLDVYKRQAASAATPAPDAVHCSSRRRATGRLPMPRS
ncbi:hypothetical protein B1A87_005460 [Arthrobacter sp. KBS0703]|nr:hypothetical protein B1A87_005460 [Arthrobacter sp. KBS0703]